MSVSPLNKQLQGVLMLSRWQEHIPFVVPLTLLGAVLAFKANGSSLDLRLLLVIAANICAVAYAFMINDIEDAPDDALEAHRAQRNAVSSGLLSVRQGWMYALLVAGLGLALYALAGTWCLIIGTVTILLSHFYSWKPVRLKAWPVTDVVSHSLMLSGLLFLTGYFAYDAQPSPMVWLIAAAFTLISVYGQLYNQLRDFNMDTQAGLKNTAIMVGPTSARVLMYAAVIVAAGILVYAIVQQVAPLWLIAVPIVVGAVFLFVRLPNRDARGTIAADKSGSVQVLLLIIGNLTILVWLAAVLLRLA